MASILKKTFHGFNFCSNSLATSWDNLPEELIFIIRDNLSFVTDCIRFGAVCKSWRSSYLEAKKQCKQISDQDKIFYLSIHTPENSNQNRELVVTSFHENREICTRDMPSNIFGTFCGTWYGWIAFHGRDEFYFYNPLLRQLLSLNEFPLALGQGRRVAFSTPTGSDKRVAFIVGFTSFCMLTYPDENWTEYRSMPSFLDDIIFYKGKLFVVNWKGDLWVVNNHDGGIKLMAEEVICDNKIDSAMYLVESSKGELLLVRRCYYPKQPTKEVRVYKLRMEARKWEEIENLNENEALFIGGNQGVCILLSPFVDNNNIRPNCIYFTKDFSRKFFDMGFYSLDSRRIGITEVGNPEDKDRSYEAFMHEIDSDCWLTKLFPSI